MEQVWQDLQVDLASLSSNGSYVVSTSTKPYSSISVDEPQLLIDAILKVVSEAKK